jgi:hypothetical protein
MVRCFQRRKGVCKLNKVIRDGMVAVLYSPGFGAGWYTWNSMRGDDEDHALNLIYDPILVELVEQRNKDNFWKFTEKIEKRAKEILPDGYFGGAEDLAIVWLPKGSQFMIDEYDGSESIITQENLWLTA